MKFIILLLLTFNVFAGSEQTINITHHHYNNAKNINTLNYKIKGFFDLENDSFLYYDTEFLSNNKDKNINPIEFKYQKESDNYNFILGFNTIFWGVTESYNPVDIINHKNLLTAYDNKDKLGELMLGGSYFLDDNTISFYYLPKFYKQKFLSKEYQGGIDIRSHIIEKNNPSYGLRYSSVIDNIDLGLSYFNGVSKNYRLIPNGAKFDVFYPDLQQVGLDFQLTSETALYKLEYAHKDYTNSDKYELVAGIEYLFISDIAINGLIEILKSNDNSVFQNDIMLGLRFDFENENSTEGLVSLIYDKDYKSKILGFTGSTRLNDNAKIKANINFYKANPQDVMLNNSKNNMSLTLSYYF